MPGSGRAWPAGPADVSCDDDPMGVAAGHIEGEGLRRIIRRLASVFAIAAAAVTLIPANGQAVIGGRNAGVSDRQHYTYQNSPFSTSISAAWVQVPGAIKTVTLTSVHLLEAEFDAESQCVGTGYCSVRIVLERPTGPLLELDPVTGTDFSFDAGATDRWEAHSIKRVTPFLTAATYRVRVQARIVGTATLRLDDWILEVETVRP